AAVGADPQRAMAVAREAPGDVARQAVARVVALDQPAAALLVQADRADPGRAFAVDEQRPRARARQARAAIDHAPAVALAVCDAGVAAEPHLAVRAVDHVAGDPRAGMAEREPGAE